MGDVVGVWDRPAAPPESPSNPNRNHEAGPIFPGERVAYSVWGVPRLTRTWGGRWVHNAPPGDTPPGTIGGQSVPDQHDWQLVGGSPAIGADFDNGSGLGTPDGGVGIEDLLYYISLFEAGDIRADIDNGDGKGFNDAGVGIEDLLYFMWLFENGHVGDLSDNRFGYRGYLWDEHLNIYHVRFRVYDPRLMQWLQPDPAGFVDGINRYAYLGGKPWSGIDPYGLCECPSPGGSAAPTQGSVSASLGVGPAPGGVPQVGWATVSNPGQKQSQEQPGGAESQNPNKTRDEYGVPIHLDENTRAGSAPGSEAGKQLQQEALAFGGAFDQAFMTGISPSAIAQGLVAAMADPIGAAQAIAGVVVDTIDRVVNWNSYTTAQNAQWLGGVTGAATAAGVTAPITGTAGAVVGGVAKAAGGMLASAGRSLAGKLATLAGKTIIPGTKVYRVAPNEVGAFSVWDWSGYPDGAPRPTGPFRVLTGAEYEAARAAADAANRALRGTNPSLFKGLQIHENHPVKFGGDPTGWDNKIGLPFPSHTPYSSWWLRIQRRIEGPCP